MCRYAGTVTICDVIDLLMKYPNQLKPVRKINTFDGTIVVEVGTPTATREFIYIDHKGFETHGAK